MWLFVVIALVGVLIGAVLRGPRRRRHGRRGDQPVHAIADSDNRNGGPPTSAPPVAPVRPPVPSGNGTSSTLAGPGQPQEPAVPGPAPLPGAPDEQPV